MTTSLATAKVAVDIVKSTADIANILKKPLGKVKVNQRAGFQVYIQNQIERYSVIKTIIAGDVPVRLDRLYVNLKLSKKRVIVGDDELIDLSAKERRLVFVATAGSGKSMLMRYVYFQFLNEGIERLPVFIDLRDLNEHANLSIIEFLAKQIGDHIEGFTVDQTKHALKIGAVALFLDGFDEIDFDNREARSREINNLAGAYSKLVIFVSSRPDEIFSGWNQFHVYKIENFSEQQIRTLISRIDYDTEIKNLFLKKMDEGLYQQHKEFLVNPLLAIMMLLTLQTFAEVPAKIHLFYEYAFEALFARHDAVKGGGFRRKRYVHLLSMITEKY